MSAVVSCNLCRCFFGQCYICDEDRIEEAMNCLCMGNCGEEDEEEGSGEEDEEGITFYFTQCQLSFILSTI